MTPPSAPGLDFGLTLILQIPASVQRRCPPPGRGFLRARSGPPQPRRGHSSQPGSARGPRKAPSAHLTTQNSLPPGSARPSPSAQPAGTREAPSAKRRSTSSWLLDPLDGVRSKWSRLRPSLFCTGSPPQVSLGPPLGDWIAVSPSWSQTRSIRGRHARSSRRAPDRHRSRS